MKLYTIKKTNQFKNSIGILCFILIIIGIIFYSNKLFETSQIGKCEATEKAIKHAINTCYALEGIYPPSIEYLETHYAITIDHNMFIIDYETLGSNIMPDLMVVLKGNEI